MFLRLPFVHDRSSMFVQDAPRHAAGDQFLFYACGGRTQCGHLAASIRHALGLDATWGERRERIAQNFALERRRRRLEEVLESVMYDAH
jgi:hypothetical protein